ARRDPLPAGLADVAAVDRRWPVPRRDRRHRSLGVVMDERGDVELLTAHVDGDPDAFAEIVRRHRDRLSAVALRTTGAPEEASDALQDALISAFRRASSFRGDAQVTTWMHRIVVNSCLDRMRRRRAKATEA